MAIKMYFCMTVLQVYADCLSQSVYTTFLDAFPESDRYFQEEFKTNLVNKITEWITGILHVKHLIISQHVNYCAIVLKNGI